MQLSRKERKFFELSTVGGKDVEDAYSEVYNARSRDAVTTSVSRKRRKRPDIFEAIEQYKQELFEAAKKAQRDAVIKRAEEKALSKAEKREVLQKIISGEFEEEVIVVSNGQPIKVKRKPSTKDVNAAIKIDNDMAGHNAPNGGGQGDHYLVLMKNVFMLNNSNIPNVLTESNGDNAISPEV
jgi:hypothetical protein